MRDLYFDWFFILYIMLNILFIYIAISIRHIRDEQITVAWLGGNGISHDVRHNLSSK
jgi:hypothetical protein